MKIPHTSSLLSIFTALSPFWIFLTLFKFAGALHYTLLAPWGEQVFPIWLVGVLIGGAAFLQLSLDVPAGILLDRFGYKKLLVVTTALFLVASIGLLFGLSAPVFLFSLFMGAFGWLFVGSGSTAYVMSMSSKENVGRYISLRDVFASVGVVLSSVLIMFAVSWKPELSGIVLSIIFLCALVAIILSPVEHHQNRSLPRKHHVIKTKWHVIKDVYKTTMKLRPASFMLMVTSFCGSTFYAIVWFVVPLVIAHEVSSGVLSVGLGVFDFAVVALGFVLGKVVDTYDKKLLVFLGLSLFAVMGIVLGFHFGALFLLFGFIATTGDELSELSLWAWLYQLDTKHENTATVSGIIGLFDDLGWTVGPIVAGVLYGIIGPEYTIMVGGLLILTNLLLFFLLVRNPIRGGLPFLHRTRRKRYKH